MIAYCLRRFGLLLVALWVASVVVFVMLRLLPGDLASVIAGPEAPRERVEAIRIELGLDRPLAEQYVDWLGGVVTGDFGRSALNDTSVAGELGEKLTVTGPLV